MAINFPLIILFSSQIFKMLYPHRQSFLNSFKFVSFLCWLIYKVILFLFIFCYFKNSTIYFIQISSVLLLILVFTAIPGFHIKFSCFHSFLQSVTVLQSFLIFHDLHNFENIAQLFLRMPLNLKTHFMISHYQIEVM